MIGDDEELFAFSVGTTEVHTLARVHAAHASTASSLQSYTCERSLPNLSSSVDSCDIDLDVLTPRSWDASELIEPEHLFSSHAFKMENASNSHHYYGLESAATLVPTTTQDLQAEHALRPEPSSRCISAESVARDNYRLWLASV